MAIARLPVIIVSILCLLQDSVNSQQCGLCNKSNIALTNSVTRSSDPRIAIVSNAKNSQNCNGGNSEPSSSVQQNNKPQLTGLQQFLNLQQPQQPLQPPLNFQPLAVNTPPQGSQLLQQPLNLQQQNVQQPPNLQQAVNLQQVKNQQTVNFQPLNQQQCLDLQILNEPIRESINFQSAQPMNLEQLIFQQQAIQSPKSSPASNIQVLGQQIHSDISQTTLPVINGQVQGLPSQVSQGVFLSNLGINSNLPSLISSNCKKPSSAQLSVIIPQNNVACPSNAPIPTFDGSKTSDTSSISVSSSCLPSEYPTNNSPQLTLHLMPLNLQSLMPCQQNQPLESAVNPMINCQYQPPQQISVQTQQPIQLQQQYFQTQPVQSCPTQGQTVPSQPIQLQYVPAEAQFTNQQTQPDYSQKSQLVNNCQVQELSPQVSQGDFKSTNVQSISSQPITTQSSQSDPCQSAPALSIDLIQNQLSQTSIDNQPDSLASFLLSQLQSSGLHSPYKTNPCPSNNGAKSSSIKSLLPLLFNLLAEKNGGCSCPPNYNCGCKNFNNMPDSYAMNPFMNNYNNNYNGNIQSPSAYQQEMNSNNNCNPYKPNNNEYNETQIDEGYSNKIKSGKPREKEVSQNLVDSEETEDWEKVQEKKKKSRKESRYSRYKKRKNESEEYEMDDDYGDSYENED